MLEEIGSVDNIPEFIERAKDKDDPFRLMGFGHRVYKNYDPRATVMREACHDVLNELNIDDPLLDVAMELERIALSDEYFVEKKLYPNVDFYSGIILKPLVFQFLCLRLFLQCHAPLAGLLIGMKCMVIQPTVSADLVSFILAKINVSLVQCMNASSE